MLAAAFALFAFLRGYGVSLVVSTYVPVLAAAGAVTILEWLLPHRRVWRPPVSEPVALFQTHLATGINVLGNKPQYAVARDGRFLLNTAIESPSPPRLPQVTQ